MNLLELPFDQYQRYKMVQEIVDLVRHKNSLSILDVGASADVLREFLNRDSVITTGLKDQPALQTYSSGLALPFQDGVFDVVTSVDSLEHVTASNRNQFLKELSRVSSDLVIIAAPFQNEGVVEAEKFLYELIRSKYGEPYHFLEEHASHGLPNLNETIEFFQNKGYRVLTLPNGYLHHWLVALSVFFLLQWRFENPELSARFNSYYNTHFYSFDNREPSYRKALVCSRWRNLEALTQLQSPAVDSAEDRSQHLITLSALARVITERWSEKAVKAADEIEKLNQTLQEHTARSSQEIESLMQTLREQERKSGIEIEKLNHSLSEQGIHVEDLNRDLKELNKVLKTRTVEAAQKDDEIQMLYRTILEKERFVDHFKTRATTADLQVMEKERTNQELKQKLDNIKSSMAWKMVQRFYSAFLAIAPYQGKRWTLVMKLLGRNFPTVRKEAIRPKVSIIIPVFNKCDLTRQCIHALRQNTNYDNLEIIVIDDCSTDETVAFLASQKDLIVLRNESNLGFVLSCNRAASVATGKYIVLLNNDTQPRPGWLDALVSVAEEDPTIGACGAKLVYPDGRLQEAGGIIFRDGTAANFGNGDDPNKEEYNYPRDTSYCSGACLLVRRDLWIKVGGFDERYSPAYFEDVDLCFAIRSLGYRVIYQPKSEVTHLEGGTAGTDVQKGTKRYQIINYEKFVEKWKSALQQYPH